MPISRAVARATLLIVTFGAVGIAGLQALVAAPTDPDDDGYPAARLVRTGDVLSLDGLLVAATNRALEHALAEAPVRVLRVRSYGGIGPSALQLAQRLNAAAITVEVGPGMICSSACVMMLAELDPDRRHLDPNAWLRVHGNWIQDPPATASLEDGMAPWVRRLSPRWFAYLAACRSRPLVRNAGIAMTWSEIQAVEHDRPAADCDRIAFRTKDWLFAHR